MNSRNVARSSKTYGYRECTSFQLQPAANTLIGWMSFKNYHRKSESLYWQFKHGLPCQN